MIGIHNKEVNVNRLSLIVTLKKNEDLHSGEYKQAVADYRTVLLEKLTDAQRQAEGGSNKNLVKLVGEINKLQPPPDHRKDYSDVIEMLEHSVDETITLDQVSFKAFVKNDWPWSQQFKDVSSFYNSTAGSRK